MITRKHEPIVFGLILAGLMSCLVSGIATLRALGPAAGFLSLWLQAWLTSWLVAFPAVLLAAPLARRLARGIIERVTTAE
ncbi:MAG: DUF2798 domain-containing protein [Betaproteobacteria bacterium]